MIAVIKRMKSARILFATIVTLQGSQKSSVTQHFEVTQQFWAGGPSNSDDVEIRCHCSDYLKLRCVPALQQQAVLNTSECPYADKASQVLDDVWILPKDLFFCACFWYAVGRVRRVKEKGSDRKNIVNMIRSETAQLVANESLL